MNSSVIIAAPSSASGKTTVVCGLLYALKNRGLRVQAFKCGPDYIDPMFHERVLDIPSRNLDSFFCDRNTLQYLYNKVSQNADINIIEGVMGYYDGLLTGETKASTYEIQTIIKAPTVLIVNCRGMSLTVAAIIKGLMDFRSDSNIRAVILNNTSETVYNALKPVIERELNIKVLGYMPKLDFSIESRHLGLVTPNDIKDIEIKLNLLKDIIEKNVDVDALLEISKSIGDIDNKNNTFNNNVYEKINTLKNNCNYFGFTQEDNKVNYNDNSILNTFRNNAIKILDIKHNPKVNIAVAKDEAFSFYYKDNLELLELLGCNLIYFSPLEDKAIPSNINGMLLGGGYPELYLKELSENRPMLDSIYTAIENNMPILAECGGFMYLHSEIEGDDGKAYPMVGAIKGSVKNKGSLSHFGYITLEKLNIKGHEFHYFESTNNGEFTKAVKPNGKSWEAMHSYKNLLCGFPHLYYYSNIGFAEGFVKKCVEFRDGK